MTDHTEPLIYLIDEIEQFRLDRNWQQFHTPENLAKGIITEAAELLELFLWQNSASRQDIIDELSDVMIYCLNMASIMDIDVTTAIRDKMRRNAQKYPVQSDELPTE